MASRVRLGLGDAGSISWLDRSVRTGGFETKRKHPDVKNRVFISFTRSQTEAIITRADQSNAGIPMTK